MTEVDIALKAIQIYAAQHPRPSSVTQLQAAEMLDVSHPTLRKLIRAGEIKTNKLGRIPITEIDLALAGRVA